MYHCYGQYPKRPRTNKMALRPCESLFFSETTKVVKVKNVPLGILRLVLNSVLVCFVVMYQMLYSKGYQAFTEGQTSLSIKVKGSSM